MVGQVIRVVEAPISLSINVACKGAILAGRVAGWALTGLAREVFPDRRDEGFPSAADDYPAEPASTSTWESPDATEEQSPTSPIEEELEVSVTEVGLEAAAPIDEELEASMTEAELAASPIDEELEAVFPSEEEREVASSAEEETAPGGATEDEGSPVENGVPPVGGEDRAVVEHEPGIETSVRARDPHSALNNPVTDADLTEWPDPYDHREDPRDPGEEMVFGGDAGHTHPGATSTSEPHPSQDPEAEQWEGPKRDKVDQ